MKKSIKITAIVTALFALVLTLQSCGGSSSAKTTDTVVESQPSWSYSEDVDKMSDETKYVACTVSLNKIDFEFPYNGGSTFYLYVRKQSKESANEVYMYVDKGQFITSFGTGETVRVKFDNEKPLLYTYDSAADGNPNVIYISDVEGFLKKLKASKKLIIEATFFSAGAKQIEFNTEGLKWDR